ncbi:MAG: hypothetical protein CM15mV71_450 [Caudoviricetes sp.]|nr:MAG: hypothetical protein CM15mV71_450 [Caudoviricetes sp.]
MLFPLPEPQKFNSEGGSPFFLILVDLKKQGPGTPVPIVYGEIILGKCCKSETVDTNLGRSMTDETKLIWGAGGGLQKNHLHLHIVP